MGENILETSLTSVMFLSVIVPIVKYVVLFFVIKYAVLSALNHHDKNK